MTADASSPGYSKDRPFLARLTERRRLSKPGSGKDTQHFVVDISGSGLTYKCGDSLGVFPTNDPAHVDAVLQALQLRGDEPVLPPKDVQPLPLREALLQRFSLAQPTKKVLQTFHDLTAAEDEKARLHNLLNATKPEELHAYLEQREFLDLLEEYPGARFTAQSFVDQLRKLQPRLYSIASSPACHPQEIHLTVAVVRYETNNRPRIGVASTYLADRAPLHQPAVPVFVSHSHFGLPEDHSRDIIMVGPGTGIAPFRAFVQERLARNASGRMWVFFGDQRRAFDYLYEEEWETWHAGGRLARLDLAFSRDQAHKIYVQDRMQEHAAELWAWLQGGAAFYVCGDAKRMAKDVDLALHDIIA
ncbi:MAG TPA: sulfite reductase subunit alpha, partial [Opitutales bacterium]|nr:sulfite reductase subunit alpha [Opitutales bacterium]